MQNGSATRVIAACLGLCAFMIALIAGLYAGNPADEIVGMGLVALVVCQIVGVLVGMGIESIVRERLRAGSGGGAGPVPAESAGPMSE